MKSISASSLIEYLHSSPSRRTAIIKTAVAPPVFLLDRYGVMYRAAKRALGTRSLEPLQHAHNLISQKTPRNQFHRSRIANTLESLENAKLLLADVIKSELGLATTSPIDANIEIEGISVKISPTGLVFTNHPQSGMNVGVLKLHCSKGFKLTPVAAADYGALLHWYTANKFKAVGQANSDLCFTLDVFSTEKHQAPKSYKMRQKTITEACQEIADRWDKVASRQFPKTQNTQPLGARKIDHKRRGVASAP